MGMNNDQDRADFEAWAKTHYYLTELSNERNNDIYGEYVDLDMQGAFEAYQAGRAALQSQDMATIIEALEAAQSNLGPRRPFGSSDPDSDDYDQDAFVWDYYQKALDCARRIDGET